MPEVNFGCDFAEFASRVEIFKGVHKSIFRIWEKMEDRNLGMLLIGMFS